MAFSNDLVKYLDEVHNFIFKQLKYNNNPLDKVNYTIYVNHVDPDNNIVSFNKDDIKLKNPSNHKQIGINVDSVNPLDFFDQFSKDKNSKLYFFTIKFPFINYNSYLGTIIVLKKFSFVDKINYIYKLDD